MGARSKINAISLNVKIHKRKSVDVKARTKDSGFKAKACNYVLKDNQGPWTKAKDNIPAISDITTVRIVDICNSNCW